MQVGDVMPSLRAISLNLGVSVPSVSKAFQILEKEGILQSCGERRRWQIRLVPERSRSKRTARTSRSGHSRQGKTLLYLTSLPMSEWLTHSVEVYADLVSVMSSHGWEVTHRVIGFHEAKSPRKSWSEMVG